MDSSTLKEEGKRLIEKAMANYDGHFGFGSMSCAVYDSAWVSLITKTVEGHRVWLFPECFLYLLNKQGDDGAWEACASEIDGILNTAASLLALKRHASEPLQINSITAADLENRIERAITTLDFQLNKWDVQATVHVGFEILVPALLELLENEGIRFSFAGRTVLSKINAAKMSRFRPEYLYGTTKMTAVHSLEAFIGKIDFDRVVQHKVQGAMMASPSSTAAYLMHTSNWDEEAEAYLKHVVASGPGKGDGGVPSAYPSTYFEFTWILSTLLEGGFNRDDLESPHLDRMLHILVQSFEDEKGLLGFAPQVGSDADDTAKTILSLNLLGEATLPDSLIKEYGANDHFRTYSGERDPSFSANCNVLIALLHTPDPKKYSSEIEKAVRFLCKCWWDCDGAVKDKWNLSRYYPFMLMAQAFTDLLVLLDNSTLPEISTELLRDQVSVALFQAALRTLLTQDEDGSWNQSREQTAYAVIVLAKACQLSFTELIEPQLRLAIARGREFLQSPEAQSPDYIWIEKVTYASPFLSESYVLAAMKAPTDSDGPKAGSSWLTSIPAAKIKGFVKFYRQTPLFSSVPEWQICASLIEGYLFQPLLRQRRLTVFPREDMEEDKYFEYIPFTWTGCNNRNSTFASAAFLNEMMVISFLNYQADEFMEVVAGTNYGRDTSALRLLIENVFEPFQTSGSKRSNSSAKEDCNGEVDISSAKRSRLSEGYTNGASTHNSGLINGAGNKPANDGDDANASELLKVREPLVRFVTHVMNHPAVAHASTFDQANLQRELKTFLLAHVSQTEDNGRFEAQDFATKARTTFETPNRTFFNWVRTISADHTSCPYSFAFVSCLLSEKGRDCFESAEEKYIASDVCRHLATMCRMYNDFGSIARDRAEKNLNSINFPEFAVVGRESNDESEGDDQAAKEALFRLAKYERECLTMSLARLQEMCGSDPKRQRNLEIFRMFCDVTDLYGQIYVVRDIASRMFRTNEERLG